MTWLAGLPPRYVEEDPWMLLWRAGCQIAVNSPACRDDCDKAITLFRRRRDAAGAYLAWSTATFSIAYESISADLFDPWLALFDTLRREFPEFPSEEIEARVANSMLLAVTWRRPQHPDAESWAERAFELSRGKSDVNARAQTLFVWVMHHIQSGNFRSAVAAVPEAWQLATAREGPPLTAVIARVAIAWTWLAGEKDSRRAATEGFALAKSAAVANGDCECLLNLAAMALHDGDADTASGRLREVEKRLGQSGQAYRLWYHSYVTWEALVRNDPLKAASAARSTLQFMQTGRPWDEAVGLTLATLALHESGAKEEARQQLSHLLALAERMRSPFVEFMARLIDAHVAFDRQHDAAAVTSLARAMQLGHQGGYFHMHGWRSSVMARLCARALDAGIEVDYVRSLIQRRRLVADVSVSADVEIWPWPIRVYTFGRFAVIRDDEPLTFSRKVQRRPLGLLKTLIALGGREVREERLIDAL
jgi:LuxR family maltose regulon positive regulatory protein